jgi:xanthine dehydrogenase YagT iron-sulfur-binding subunit
MLREHARGDLSMNSFQGDRQAVISGRTPLNEQEIRERMAGNICRCGAYSNIVEAIATVAKTPSI